MSQRYIGGVVTETTNVAQSPWTGEWTQQAALQGFAGAQAPLKVANSLRFRSSASAYLSRTPSVAGNRQTWTWSGWVKRGALGGNQGLFSVAGTTDATYFLASISSDTIYIGNYSTVILATTQVLRDPSAWYHLVIVLDTTQATANNRLKLYLNGTQITAFSNNNIATYYTQNSNQGINQAAAHSIGRETQSAVYYFDGYLTEINFIDGQALPPTAFGTINKENGVWSPSAYTGTYGTNGFKLNFSNGTSTTTLGYDSSGNGNNWTTNNISLTAGSTYDWMIDSPTKYPGSSYGVGNYATLNPVDAYSGTMVDGNLYWYGTYGAQNGHGARSTIQVRPTGKWYVEAYNTTVAGSGNSCMLGFTASTQPLYTSAFAAALTPWIGVDASVYTGIKFYSAGVSGSLANGTVLFASYVSGDIVNFAIDFDAGKIWVGKAGTWYNSGNPASGTNATATFSVGSAVWAFWAEYVASSNNVDRSGAVLNFGQRPFAYTPPSGYKSLCTQNLPGVTIQNGAQYMAATTYTGTAGTQAISNSVNGVSFQPGFVWIKNRGSGLASHMLQDSVRGNYEYLQSNATATENTNSGYDWFKSFDASGFTVAATSSNGTSTSEWNSAGYTYIGWQWKAGGTAVTNTAGSITSSVSANQTAGFSVVTYTGTGANATVGHGLGVTPSMVFIKARSLAGENWIVGHVSLPSAFSSQLNLNSTAAYAASSNFNSTNPTASVFSIGSGTAVNSNTNTYVAYCFAAIPGYSAFGSYTGNGSTNGPFVYCGFRPRWVMIKLTSGVENWYCQDSSRGTYNANTYELFPNLSNAEQNSTSYSVDFLSNGFKLRTSDTSINASGGTYIYAAFAENPFQNALAR